jgi:predicted anti-sigma-YlaC factor YlaD
MKEITCEKVLMARMTEADGERAELSPDDLQMHLSKCESCAAEAAQMQKLDGMLRRSSRADVAVDLWPSVNRRLDQSTLRVSWQPFVVAAVLLVAYKLFEMIPEEAPGMIIQVAPLVIFGALMLFLRENPFKINSELVLEK